MNSRNLLIPGLIVSLIKKYYSFVNKISTSNTEVTQMIYAPVRANNCIKINPRIQN